MAGTIILADYLHPSNDLRNKQVSYGEVACFLKIGPLGPMRNVQIPRTTSYTHHVYRVGKIV